MLLVIIFVLSQIYLASSNEQPKITPLQARIHLKLGKKASFACVLEEGSLPVDYVWSKGNNVISSSEHTAIESYKGISSLIIKSIEIQDSGNYTCRATNQFGSDSSTSQLIVEGPPIWLKKPADVRVGPKERVNIECNGIGYPSPSVSWRKQIDSEWRDLFESTNIFTKVSPTEIAGNQLIKEKDEGKYGCEVSNGINPSLWTEFKIKVSGKLELHSR
ncbi:cell adhesion molecule Dscam1-like isoform X2 [Brevipalpus obovatus]|uniref:cell adhesion molecule Dscam1-like isoform X2 n=1 Tax=Brevipalpus obovatus TaxID=246614 RepID=UPI003D9EFBB3